MRNNTRIPAARKLTGARCRCGACDDAERPAMTAPVTLRHKCYVFVCQGCGLLADSSRSDAITCGTACRVRYHRNGRRETLQAIAKLWDTSVPLMARADAIARLSPEASEDVRAGQLTIEQAQVRIWPLYMTAVRRALEERERKVAQPEPVGTA